MGSSTERVVAAVLRRDGRVLLCHRNPLRENFPNVWDLPGGHIDSGEDSVGALIRELAEELGIGLDPAQLSYWTTLEAANVEMTVYVVDEWQGEPRNVAPDEHDEIRWVSMTEVSRLELAHSTYPELLGGVLTPGE